VRDAGGYYRGTVEGAGSGTRYFYRLDGGRDFPDPASRFQPEGVHGPSEIVGSNFEWHDSSWRGLALSDYIFYELHVGTFTPEGTLDAAGRYLDYLIDLGITAIELMPVAQFPGERNWGYDGVYPFAVQNSYGGPQALKRFVNAAHQKGLAVALDVVYNHLGPEGNYLANFGPYFTDRYHTPWGGAVNFDGPDGGPVRRYVIENALRWVTEFHIDALRLDAVHAIFDGSARHILEELAAAIHQRGKQLGRTVQVIAESDLNDRRLVEPASKGGYGLDAQWSDDFHHALHGVITGEQTGYYRDFGSLRHLSKALCEGFVYTGQFSEFRRRDHGTPALDLPGERFVVFSQNHDQIGNRMLGERFTHLLDFEQLKILPGVLLLSPFVPLLFMGQEYGELAPFLYFVSHSEPQLIDSVRAGRRNEFAAFSWRGEVPDPQEEETFTRSRLNHALRESGRHRVLFELYQELIRLRKQMPSLKQLAKDPSSVFLGEEHAVISLVRSGPAQSLLAVFHFKNTTSITALPAEPGTWRKLLDSAAARWLGPGSAVPDELVCHGSMELPLSPYSFCLMEKEHSTGDRS
jgi:maltooligosyltrehalose trehalohydrolase